MGSGNPETAGDLLRAIAADLSATIEAGVPAALADRPDAVHQLRTSVRRLRNVLAVLKKHAEAEALSALRGRLKVFGDVLGAARDLEVRIALAEEVLRQVTLPEEVHERLVQERVLAHAEARGRLERWCDRDLPALLVELRAWSEEPPLGDRAERSAEKAARKALARQAERTLGLIRIDPALLRTGVGAEELTRAHELRKAGRRLRHVGEAFTAGPGAVLGKRARHLAAAGHTVQSLLGDHRDAFLLAADAHDLAEKAAADGRARAPYDAVSVAAMRRAGPVLDELPTAVDELAEAAVDFVR